MKRLFYFLCIVSVFSLTSCITIIEEIFLNKDGSGKFLLTVDLSAVMGMKEMLAGKLNSANSDSLSLLQEKFDSIIYFNDMKDSVRRTLSYPHLVEKAHLQLKGDEEAGILKVTVHFPFKNVEEINQFQQDIQRYGKGGLNKEMTSDFLGYQTNFSKTKKSIERVTTYGEAKEVKEEDRLAESMSKMMFATARVKSIYHLPGKIKSTTIPGATVKGNQCEVELSYPDFINRKKTMDGIITYK
ncbi:MAG: hypothetical protein EBU52_06260 [Cytophagia bacterium]|nr:hypothetical protein [Cytophagia bacterium]